ncbi:hypothetical protein GCM10022403_047440 [Streptomyces coacervatus]|uniref:Uncharacterized protein n=2 Tax=Streptomyces coacervatus TaxID=647381 RepID=A0ABP7HYZ1_9ACTN
MHGEAAANAVSPVAEPPGAPMSLFLFLALMAVVLGIIGFAAHGLFYLLVIGAVVLVADLAYAALRFRRGGRKHRVVR